MPPTNAGFRPPEALDGLPTALIELDRSMLHDGAVWRRRLPDADGAAERAVARLNAAPAVAPDSWPLRDVAGAPPAHIATTPPGHAAGRVRPHGRARGLAAVAAMVAVVGLLAALLLKLAPGRSGITGRPTPTAPSFTGPRGQWVAVSRLTGSSDPVLSPLDPNLAYQSMYDASTPYVRRTDDGGATWHRLPIPSVEGLSQPGIPGVGLVALPSPLDRDAVFLVINAPVQPGTGRCARAPAARAPGGAFLSQMSGIPYCQYSYLSRDRGLHWRQVALPSGDHGWLGGDSGLRPLSQLHRIVAQGDRLYSFDHVEGNGSVLGYLVSSDDGGLTWRAIDGAIRAQGAAVLDYDCTPDGATLFAVATDPLTATSFDLWRSDDAGAHWTKVDAEPFTSFGGLAVIAAPGGGTPLLYVAAHVGSGSGYPASAADFRVSSDGGHTWVVAPGGGVAADSLMPAILGALDDGSIVVQSPAGAPSGAVDLEFYAWRAGQSAWRAGQSAWRAGQSAWRAGQSAWRRVTPPVFGERLIAITPGGPAGPQALWVAATEREPNTSGGTLVNVQRYVLP